MKKQISYISLLLLVLVACKPQAKDDNGFRIYVIEKGGHYSDVSGVSSIETDEFNFVAKFDSSAIYTFTDTLEQLDINKLYGFTEDNLSNDRYNSARIGWRWYKNQLQLFAYCYNKGVLENETMITKVSIGKEVVCSIKNQGASYLFIVDGTSVSMPRKSTSTRFKGYKLFPYFGGTQTAPHNVTILLKDI
jgi:hypothetical protein